MSGLTFSLKPIVEAPRQLHLDAAHRILRYLKSSLGQGLFFPANRSLNFVVYCEADWGGCESTRWSTTSFFISLGGAPVSWRSKKQHVVARSSAEAEYRAMASTVSEVIWVRWLLSELGVPQPASTPLYWDNQAALHIAANPVFHERTKHVEMDCYFVRERVQSGHIVPLKFTSHLQLADLFTKGLGADRFRFLLSKLSVRVLPVSTCGGVLGRDNQTEAQPSTRLHADHVASPCTCVGCITIGNWCKGYINACNGHRPP
ncbi:unnamed protein product [Linum trigynum]|uniref:Uncharacterized protein n=1 Tax=Linum trigynum TaxID=586398 RepID=A0AAV2DBI8_9ROSI